MVKIRSLPETIKEKSTFRAKALPNVDFSFIVSGSERAFTFRVSLNTLPTLAALVRDIVATCHWHACCNFLKPFAASL